MFATSRALLGESSFRSSFSSGATGRVQSKTKRTKAASSAVRLASSTPSFSTGSSALRRPAVSRRTTGMPRMFAASAITSLVVPGRSVTIARSVPNRALRRLDLPTLEGRYAHWQSFTGSGRCLPGNELFCFSGNFSDPSHTSSGRRFRSHLKISLPSIWARASKKIPEPFDFAAEAAFKLGNGHGRCLLGFGADQIVHSFCLSQIQLAVEESLFCELAWLAKVAPASGSAPDPPQHHSSTVAVQLKEVFACVGVGSNHQHEQTLINGFACGSQDFGEIHPAGWGLFFQLRISFPTFQASFPLIRTIPIPPGVPVEIAAIVSSIFPHLFSSSICWKSAVK